MKFMTTKIFIHGLESSNQGNKSVFFKRTFPDILIPNFRGNLQDRMERLNEILSGKSKIKLVGSSFGGLMASIFAMKNEPRVDKLILLAPAINLLEFAHYHEIKLTVPVWIYHGKDDELIPLKAVEKVAKNSFQNLSFNIVDDDHNLHKTFKTIDWNRFLL
jgi:predicted esterase